MGSTSQGRYKKKSQLYSAQLFCDCLAFQDGVLCFGVVGVVSLNWNACTHLRVVFTAMLILSEWTGRHKVTGYQMMRFP